MNDNGAPASSSISGISYGNLDEDLATTSEDDPPLSLRSDASLKSMGPQDAKGSNVIFQSINLNSVVYPAHQFHLIPLLHHHRHPLYTNIL